MRLFSYIYIYVWPYLRQQHGSFALAVRMTCGASFLYIRVDIYRYIYQHIVALFCSVRGFVFDRKAKEGQFLARKFLVPITENKIYFFFGIFINIIFVISSNFVFVMLLWLLFRLKSFIYVYIVFLPPAMFRGVLEDVSWRLMSELDGNFSKYCDFRCGFQNSHSFGTVYTFSRNSTVRIASLFYCLPRFFPSQ